MERTARLSPLYSEISTETDVGLHYVQKDLIPVLTVWKIYIRVIYYFIIRIHLLNLVGVYTGCPKTHSEI
jgi:hypothetical protein